MAVLPAAPFINLLSTYRHSRIKLAATSTARRSSDQITPPHRWRGGAVSSCLTVRQQIMRHPFQDQNLRNALLFFAPRLLALRIRGGQSPPDQHPNGVGAG